jgi:hypothetical protein
VSLAPRCLDPRRAPFSPRSTGMQHVPNRPLVTIAVGAGVMIAEPVERKIPGLETRDHRLVNVSAASDMALNSHHLSSGIQL